MPRSLSAKAMAEVDATTDATMVAVVSAFDLSAVKQLRSSSRSLDPTSGSNRLGFNTGWLHPETAMGYGATGLIINHAEHKVEMGHVESLLAQLPDDFPVCACATDIDEARALAALSPTFIAVEPPELIGGDISVTTADPGIVSGTAEVVKAANPVFAYSVVLESRTVRMWPRPLSWELKACF